MDLLRLHVSKRAIGVLCAACAGLAGASGASAHADLSPYVLDSKIITGAWDDSSAVFTPTLRVFAYDFAEDPADPYFIGDPGINARPSNIQPLNWVSGATTLTSGSQLKIDLKVVHTSVGTPNSGNHSLLYWDGSDLNGDMLIDESDVDFGVVPGDGMGLYESLRVNRGSFDAVAGQNTGDVAGFNVGTVGSMGGIHVHLNSFLNSYNNEFVDDSVNAPLGVYLVQAVFSSSTPGIASSEPFWVAFNNGLDEGVHDVAIDFVNNSVVPEPGALGLLGITIPWLMRRRRRA